MSKFIKAVMKPSKNGIGGSFTVIASFKLDNINTPFKNVKVKIDTGCGISVLPLDQFPISKNLLSNLKSNDINNGVESIISYGVETGGKKHTIPRTYSDKMVCTALKFKHAVSDFKIENVNINSKYLHVNYDRSGNTLIGMDILKDWDIHIGTIDSGETLFLGCPKDQINDEYLQELENTFHLSSDINAMLIRQKMKYKF